MAKRITNVNVERGRNQFSEGKNLAKEIRFEQRLNSRNRLHEMKKSSKFSKKREQIPQLENGNPMPPQTKEKEYEHEKRGTGIADDYPLSDNDIKKIVAKKFFSFKDKFRGVYTRDELPHIRPVKKKKYGFILNTLKNKDFINNKNAVGHWIAIVIDNEKREILYYDPFGEKPKNQDEFIYMIRNQKQYPDEGYQFKINKIQNQSVRSSNCGFFAITFLDKILNKNYSFKKATNFHVLEGEKQMKLLRKQFNFI